MHFLRATFVPKAFVQAVYKSSSAAVIAALVLALVPITPVQAATAETIFSDGFESSGDITGWTESGSKWDESGSTTHSGNRAARAKGDTGDHPDTISLATSTVGYTNVTLSYWYHITDDLESSDHIYVEWFDGTTWTEVAEYTDINENSWTYASHSLAVEADENADFAIRFSADLGSGSDEFRLDDVLVTGDTPEPGSITGTVFNDANANGENDGEDGLDAWNLTLFTDGDTEQDAAVTSDGSFSFVDVPAGSYYICTDIENNFYQTAPTTTPACDEGYRYEVEVAEGEDISDVEIGFAPFGKVRVVVATTPDETDAEFGFTSTTLGVGDFTVIEDSPGNDKKVFKELLPGIYDVATTSVPTGWFFDGVSCNDESDPSAIDLGVGEIVTCKYTYHQLPRLTIEKIAYPSTVTGDFSVLVPGTTTPVEFVLGDESSTEDSFHYVDLGGYTIIETAVGEFDGTQAVACYASGESEPFVESATQSGTLETTLELEAGDNVTCVYTNTEHSTIIGSKIEDEDGEGEALEGEGISGWMITLYQQVITTPDDPETEETDETEYGWSEVDTTETNESGLYSFGNLLTGTYRICEVEEEDWYQSYPNGSVSGIDYCGDGEGEYGYTFTIDGEDAGSIFDGYTFGNYQYGSIAGFKWYDIDGDGALDDEEESEGLSGWTIELFADGEEESVDDTETIGGVYQFTDIAPGTYTLSEVLDDDAWVQSFPGDNAQEVVVTSGAGIININFGNTDASSISGSKWHDEDGDGVWDEGESSLGMDGFEFTLYKVGGESLTFIDSVLSDEEGYFAFEGLLAGTYYVQEESSAGWMQTSPLDPDFYTIELGVGEDLEGYDFGNIEVTTLTGSKWNDINADGYWDGVHGDTSPVETGIAGWTIVATPMVEVVEEEPEDVEVEIFSLVWEPTTPELEEDTGGDRTTKTEVTDENGDYAFSFLSNEEGWWRISEIQQDGWTQTYPDGESAQYYDVYISPEGPGEYEIEGYPGFDEEEGLYEYYDFGNWQWPIITVFKWSDLNSNGVFDEEGDNPESGVEGFLFAVGQQSDKAEGDIPIEIVAMGLTGSDGYAHIPVPFTGDFVVFEAEHDNWNATAPATRTPVVVPGFAEEGQTPFYVDSFFDAFAGMSPTNVLPGAPTAWFSVDSFFDVFVDVSDANTGADEASVAVDSFFDIFADIPTESGNKQADSFFDVFTEVTGTPGFVVDSFFDVFVQVTDGGQEVAVGYDGTEENAPLAFGNFYDEPVVVTPSSSNEEEETPGEGGGTQIFGSSFSAPGFVGAGSVLGVSTTTGSGATGGICTPYITGFIGTGLPNNPEQVRRLQTILRDYEGASVQVTGIYDEATRAAVNTFQVKYASEILTPWGLTQPTGFVYLTTRKKLNEIYCGSSFPLTAGEQGIISGNSGGSGGSTGGSTAQGPTGSPTGGSAGAAPEEKKGEETPVTPTPTSTGTTNGSGGRGFFGGIINFFGSLFGR